MAKKCQKVPKRAKIRFPGSGAPACVLARRASRRRDEGAGPKGPRRRRLGCRPKAGKLVIYYFCSHCSFFQGIQMIISGGEKPRTELLCTAYLAQVMVIRFWGLQAVNLIG